jgi:hypothetical protein
MKCGRSTNPSGVLKTVHRGKIVRDFLIGMNSQIIEKWIN